MYLQRLDITGFKSFAKKTTMEFDRGIVSIVGPNGSGKSNVADAIRWVLGEQSLKLLRGKHSEDVIFSGSSLKARLGMAEVSLTLDNEDHQMPVDYAEVVITRRIYRNGEGEYFLNKNPVRLHDIVMLLAKSNFAQKSYSVIGQGMIDQVLIASPAERKIFFDEAAGVRQFQIKREQTISKLEQTKENLEQARLLLTEIEPRLRTLTRQVRRLERRGVVEQELRQTQELYYSLRFLDLLRQREEQELIFGEQEKKRSAREKDLAKLQSELETLERDRSRQELFEELERDYSQVLERKNKVMREQVVLEGAQELAAAKSGELNVLWLQNRLRELENAERGVTTEIESLTREAHEQHQSLTNRQAEKEKLIHEHAELEKALADLKARMDREGLEGGNLGSDIETLHEEFLSLRNSLEQAESERQLRDVRRTATRLAERFSSMVHSVQRAKTSVRPKEVMEHLERFVELIAQRELVTTDLHEFTTRQERREERLKMLKESRTRLSEEKERLARDLDRLSPSSAKTGRSEEQRKVLEKQIREFDEALQKLREQMVSFNQNEQKKKDRLFQLQKAFRVQQQELNKAASEANVTRVELAKLETRRDDLERELTQELPAELADAILKRTTQESVSREKSEEQLLAHIHHLKHQMELIGGIDESVTEEFKQTDERHNFLSTQVTDLEEAMESLEEVITELDETIKKQFHQSFSSINREFAKYFKVLFNGGTAKLTLQETEILAEEETEEGEEDDEDEKEEDGKPSKPKKLEKVVSGIEIYASPAGKKITGIAMLSGGERALTSIALICAILSTRPSPFVVLDEVDAALDEANSQRFAAILKELAHRTQFITITHNRATMQISSILYGVTMSDDGISKLLSIKMEDAERVIEQHGNR